MRIQKPSNAFSATSSLNSALAIGKKRLAWIHQRAQQLLQSGTPTLSHAHTEIAINLRERTQPIRARRNLCQSYFVPSTSLAPNRLFSPNSSRL